MVGPFGICHDAVRGLRGAKGGHRSLEATLAAHACAHGHARGMLSPCTRHPNDKRGFRQRDAAGTRVEGCSERADVRGLKALLAALGVELDLLVLFEVAVSGAGDRAEVREHVRRAVVGRDEAEALVGVEPFDGASGHDVIPSLSGTTAVIRESVPAAPARSFIVSGEHGLDGESTLRLGAQMRLEDGARDGERRRERDTLTGRTVDDALGLGQSDVSDEIAVLRRCVHVVRGFVPADRIVRERGRSG